MFLPATAAIAFFMFIFVKKAILVFAMTEEMILAEIQQLPETLKLEVLHFVRFLRQEKIQSEPKISERIFGLSKGRYKLADDFDAPLDDFKEYME